MNKDNANESNELGKKILHVAAEKKLLGLIIDKDSNFQSYTKSVINTATQKLSALIKVALF